MKNIRFLILLLCAATLVFAAPDMDARKRSSKVKTAQTSSKKNSKKSSKNSKSKSSKKSKTKESGKSRNKGSKTRGSSVGTRHRYSRNYSGRSNSSKVADVQSQDSLTLAVHSRVAGHLPGEVKNAGLRVNKVSPDSAKHTVDVILNDNFTYIPVTQKFIDNIRKQVSQALPDPVNKYRINLNVGNRPLSYYVSKIDRAPANGKNEPFVLAVNPEVHPSKGMEGDIVALWHSHGRYYRGGSGWQWQRPFLFETAEDVFTMSYILPYVTPMIENAGGYVFLPRERDPNPNEVIVDNDTNDGGFLGSQPYYKEQNGSAKWEEGKGDGFIYDLPDFRDTENPFEGGTYRQVKTVKGGKTSVAGWYADIPEDGEYAVYVSYKSLPNSTKDARYTVNYSGGSKEFTVNQTMGGSTWIYLGTFPFEKGYSDSEPVVTLTNQTKNAAGTMVTADAVKIGGGMGNIARSPSRSDVYANSSKNPTSASMSRQKHEDPDAQVAQNESDEGDDEGDDETDDEEDEDVDAQMDVIPETNSSSNSGYSSRFSTSGMPRFVEGARYWLQWAGFPEQVYSPYHGRDDYKDDYTSRGQWVNWLAGGSAVLPNHQGLNIPVDVALALHSDAGKRNDDSIVGTLGIYYTNNGARLGDGTSRTNNRNLTDMVLRQITGDIRQTWEPQWTRRSMWDKSYVEARVPEVPSTLIEVMSHQNFGDMQYGLDPNFRFTVGRAIYKALGRFLAERKGRQFVVQPLPVQEFAIARTGKGKYKLTWAPTEDKLEPTAKPEKYIIYERSGANLGFRRIAETKNTDFALKIVDTDVHSFKIVAANQGGISFPSEVLALREAPNNDQPLLVVNGFTRISAPDSFKEGDRAGFRSEEDFGVPYIRDISFTGHQTEFRRGSGISFGNSGRNYVTKVVAGNTFDFVCEHGISMAEAGYGFVSASLKAVEDGKVELSKYRVIDLLLGKQKATVVGKGHNGVMYRAFSEKLQQKLRHYVQKGGNLFVSGAYVASDLYGDKASEADRTFASEVLGLDYNEGLTTRTGAFKASSPGGNYHYNTMLNDKIYAVENADVLRSSKTNARALWNFSDNRGAAVLYSQYGQGHVVVMSVPFETVSGEDERDRLMKSILSTLKK